MGKEKRLNSGPSKAESETGLVTIERTPSGKSFVLVVRNQRKILDKNEMTHLINIAHDAGDQREGAIRLLRWLNGHRDDVVLDGGLSGKDKAIFELYALLRTRFVISS
ncbi:MAG: hypothetical protein HN368_02090 [Spirochaetales bacterium]|jgi:hypothetical protein|nr:hypothetical protein [Spirochaetales bacterium]